VRVLIPGKGGRESALAWAVAKNPNNQVFVSPGNPGIARYATCIEMASYQPEDYLRLAHELQPDLVISGPEDLLYGGLGDLLRATDFRFFGPDTAGAKLEGSKVFSKELLSELGIPTAGFDVFSNVSEALGYVEAHFDSYPDQPLVIKADGAALGKGVFITKTIGEAQEAIHQIMTQKAFGQAGDHVVIEEFLVGEEVSFFVLVGINETVAFGPARDYKRVGDGDQGFNTGGMGCYSPVNFVTAARSRQVMTSIVDPVLLKMRSLGTPFIGFLYAGLIFTEDGFQVLEFNARMGDPEAQVILTRLESDFAQILVDLLDGTSVGELSWSPDQAVCVVLTSQGYPENYEVGFPITGIERAESLGCVVFHAGTKEEAAVLVTNGGRVLNVVGIGKGNQARKLAYKGVAEISFTGKQSRTDIASKVL